MDNVWKECRTEMEKKEKKKREEEEEKRENKWSREMMVGSALIRFINIHPSVCPSIHLSIYSYVSFSFPNSVCLLVCLFLSFPLSVCLPLSLSLISFLYSHILKVVPQSVYSSSQTILSHVSWYLLSTIRLYLLPVHLFLCTYLHPLLSITYFVKNEAALAIKDEALLWADVKKEESRSPPWEPGPTFHKGKKRFFYTFLAIENK